MSTSSPLVRLHLAASLASVVVVTTFLATSAITELTSSDGVVRVLRQAIVYGLPLLAVCLATAGLTGNRLSGRSKSPIVRRKRRRLQAAAAIGLGILVPCALILNHLASGPTTGSTFRVLELIEIAFGALNLYLIGQNFVDGLGLSRGRRAGATRKTGVTP